jgi:hypothetical protein
MYWRQPAPTCIQLDLRRNTGAFSAAPAGLSWLDLSHNLFTALPPALAAATSLRTLELVSRRHDLALTRQDVDILLRMPHLHTLVINSASTPPRVLRALRRGLPGLVILHKCSYSVHDTDPESDSELED